MDDRLVISIRGSLPQGEVWSVNPAFIGNFTTAVPSHAALQSVVTRLAGGAASIVTGALRDGLSSQGTVDSFRVSYYGTDGKLADYAEGVLASPLAGQNALQLPLTAAVALSLYSEIPGRRYRGRLFWPALGLSLDSTTGRIPQSLTTALATAARTMLVSLESALDPGWDAVPAIWSKTNGSGVEVSQVRVGDVPDSMRTRKDALTENYSSVAMTSN
jgi:hypothetical protein